MMRCKQAAPSGRQSLALCACLALWQPYRSIAIGLPVQSARKWARAMRAGKCGPQQLAGLRWRANKLSPEAAPILHAHHAENSPTH